MKIKVEKLRKALEVVKPGLSNKELIEQTTSFAFMGNRVVTYNDEISISHPVEGIINLVGAIKADELYALLGKVKVDEVEITQNASELIMKSGRAKAGFILQSEIKLPLEEIGKISKWAELPSNFIDATKFVVNSASNNHLQGVLTCVHFDNGGAIASDGYRISFHKWVGKLTNTVLIPATSVRELLKINPVSISYGNGWVHFKNDKNTIISCRVFEDKYVDTSPFLAKRLEGKTINLPKKIEDMIGRAEVFTKDGCVDMPLTVTLTENRMVIEGKSEYGWFRETANVSYEQEPVEFLITSDLLKGILKQSAECVLAGNKIGFYNENWTYLAILMEK